MEEYQSVLVIHTWVQCGKLHDSSSTRIIELAISLYSKFADIRKIWNELYKGSTVKHTSPIDMSAALADAVESSRRFRFALHCEPTSSRAGAAAADKEASVASCVGRETAREACGSESALLTGAQNPAANVVSFEITGCFTWSSERALLIYG